MITILKLINENLSKWWIGRIHYDSLEFIGMRTGIASKNHSEIGHLPNHCRHFFLRHLPVGNHVNMAIILIWPSSLSGIQMAIGDSTRVAYDFAGDFEMCGMGDVFGKRGAMNPNYPDYEFTPTCSWHVGILTWDTEMTILKLRDW